MLLNRRRFLVTASLALLSFGSILTAVEQLPAQLSDEEFWRIVTEFSEPGGYFRSDNFVSNEVTFQEVIPRLKETIKPGGVYLGVGPDQNFTYIVALEPKISFIVDIRRQNMLQHLMYKALFELSTDRADFLSRLFSRERPERLTSSATAIELFDAYAQVRPSEVIYHENLDAILETLTAKHGFKLSPEDRRTIEHVFSMFFDGGPDITYSGPYGGGRMPSYAFLLVQTDGERNRSYMASEENFRILQYIQKRNLLVPLVGDFAGPKALRAAGDYVRKHGARVSVIYTSNVEQYLFQQADDWIKYYNNVATLPLDETSTFIRSQFNMGMYSYRGGMRSAQLLCSVPGLLKAFKAGEIRSYWDVLQMSN